MRDIIFRCWDKKSKKYRNINTITFNGNNLRTGDSLPYVVNLWGEDIIEQKDVIVHREKGEYTLEQYTGVKDKNGTLIFEGDIILFDDLGEEGYEFKEGYDFINKATVIFDEERCGFTLSDYESESELLHNEYYILNMITGGNLEVIGNIHDSKMVEEE